MDVDMGNFLEQFEVIAEIFGNFNERRKVFGKTRAAIADACI